MTKAFSEIGNTGAESVSDEGRSHSFSRSSYMVKTIIPSRNRFRSKKI